MEVQPTNPIYCNNLDRLYNLVWSSFPSGRGGGSDLGTAYGCQYLENVI
jgi:hypothetical protein